MLRASAFSCPLCEAQSLLRKPYILQRQWQQIRFVGHVQRYREARRSNSFPQAQSSNSGDRFPPLTPSARSKRTPSRPSDVSPSSRRPGQSSPSARPSIGSRPRFGRQEERIGQKDRMVLSSTVARGPATGAELKRKKRPEPFGYLNETRAPRFIVREKENEENKRDRRGGPKEESRRRHRTGNEERYHALKMQRTLSEVPYGTRNYIKRKIEEIESFESLPLLVNVQKAIADALPDLQYRSPTPAQRVAIPAILGMGEKRRRRSVETVGLKSFLLAAETGSGKTLAYLLPTLDAIKRAEAAEAEEEARVEAERAAQAAEEKKRDPFELEPPPLTNAVDPARPRAIILVPSAELVNQVGAVVKSLSHVVKFRAAPISASNSATVIRNRLFSEHGVDVVISTPPLLSSIAETNPNILSRVSHLIVDEADSLMDRSFKPFTAGIIERAMPSLRKLIMCSATIPRYLDKYLAEHYPDMNRLVTPNLHAIPRRVQLGVIDVNKDPYRGNKLLACADTIWQIGKSSADYDPVEGKEKVDVKRILVFVNEREDTEEVAKYLVKKGIDAMAFHRDTEPSRQAATLTSFTGSPKASSKAETAEPAKPAQTQSNRHLPNTKVVVTTDLGSRGIDTVAVRHVILYDVPHTSIDFIHRLGRTGRMGRRGRGIVLVGAGDRADVVKEVRDAMFRGEALI